MNATTVMQNWLALEHEAIWLLPIAGARFDELNDLAHRTQDAHLATRDELLERIHRTGTDPVATALAYDVGPLKTIAAAREAVREVESRIAAACLALVGAVSGDDRTFATKSLRRAALAELAWGGEPQAFPGLPN